MSVLFRLELYVEDIEKSIDFYENIVGLEPYGRNERCVRFNYDCFSLLVTSERTLPEEHYFNRSRENTKGNGVELIIVVEELETIYNRCKEQRYPIEVEVESYPWGMRGFKLVDPDGYYVRITSK